MESRRECRQLEVTPEGNRMLVVSRKSGEKILVGDHIVVQVVDISPGRVKLGIEAPADVLILRQELLPRFLNSPQGTSTNEEGKPNVSGQSEGAQGG